MEAHERIQGKARRDDEEVMRGVSLWIQLLVGLACGVLGVVAITTKQIGTLNIREQEANGVAEFAGLFLIVISVITLALWIRKFRSSRRQ